MNIRNFKQNVALLCISLVLVASVQPALADNILADPVQPVRVLLGGGGQA